MLTTAADKAKLDNYKYTIESASVECNTTYAAELKDKKAWRAAYYSLSDSIIMYVPQSQLEYKQLVLDWHQKAFDAYREVIEDGLGNK